MDLAINYLKDRYNEELARFDHFENKCAKFLTFVTVIIATITALCGFDNSSVFHPNTPIDWLVLIVLCFGFIAIASSWGHALSALQIGDFSVMPKSKATAEYLICVDAGVAKKHIYQCYVDVLEKMDIQLTAKSRPLQLAYEELVISAVCLCFVCLLTAFKEITK
jgi:hypothetical protein